MDSIVARHESLWWTAHGVILLLVLAHGVILWSSTNYDVTPTSFQLNGIELWLDCNKNTLKKIFYFETPFIISSLETHC